MLEPGYSSDYLLDTKIPLNSIGDGSHTESTEVITMSLKAVNGQNRGQKRDQGQLAAARDALAQLFRRRHLLLATRAL
jgi:hypothetical protein